MRITTLFFLSIFFFNHGQSFAQNLIQNGSFELGGPGNGFIVDGAGYVMLNPPFSGTTVNGNYAFATDPTQVNTGFLPGGDITTGSGMMMIIDGNTVGGQQRFYKAGNTGGGVCGLTVGQPHTFFYWVKSISANSSTVATRANIGIQFNNVASFNLVSGSTLAPHPNQGWQQVVYQFTPNSNCVNIELFNNNVSATGNKFAIDDVTVTGPPNSLQYTYSLVPAGCGSPTNFIAIYPKGGTPPYAYSLSGAASLNNTTGTFDNLTSGTYNITVSDANNASITVSGVALNASPSSGVVTQDTTICQGQSVNIVTVSPVNLNNWTTNPNDPTLQSLNNTTFTATPAQTTTYSVGPSGSANLIYNNSFQLGATGFFTQYQLIAINPNAGQGVAGITSNAQTWFNPFDACTDQDGTNTMLVVDAATTANTVIWRQTVPVQTNTAYNFSYWATSVVNLAPAQLRVIINGTPINTTTLTTFTCNWQNINVPWNSGAASLATIEIVNMNLASNGNDFAIDNLSFSSAANCQVTVTVVQSLPLNIPATHTVCQGGSITLSVPNTTNLVWQTPSGSTVNSATLVINNAQSVNAGIYNVSVPSGGGACTLPAQTNLIVTPGPTLNTSTQNVLCNGQSNGSATVNPTGNGPFIFLWSNGGSGQTINNLSAQNYSVQVTDANGCVSNANVSISQPNPLIVNVNTTPSQCNQSNGSGSAVVTGGSGPFNFNWSSGGSGPVNNNLPPGNQSVTVTDANNCAQSASFSIGVLDGPEVNVTTVDVSCNGQTDGAASVGVNNGSAPFTYSWTPNVSSSNSATNLGVGTYQVTVTDNGGCAVTTEFTINQPSQIQISAIPTNPTCGLTNGALNLNVSGGVGSYQYLWQPDLNATSSAQNLPAGTYNVQVTDANGCLSNISQTLVTTGTIPINTTSSSIVIQNSQTANLGVVVGNGITDFSVSWSPTQSLSCSTCQFTQASPSENTVYIVTVTTPDGCIATSSTEVIVFTPCGEVFLPTIFSPNTDNLNDFYCVLGSCIESMELIIYNRWGEQVFRSTDPNQCWDGYFRGVLAPVGVYAYKFTSTESNGKITVLSGNISVVR